MPIGVASDAGYELIVDGYVNDSMNQPVDDATVTVSIMTLDDVVRTAYVVTTSGGGYYIVLFGGTEWSTEDFVDVLATYGTDTGSSLHHPADEFGTQLQDIDVTISTLVIPEFSSFLAVSLTILVTVTVMGIRRSRPR